MDPEKKFSNAEVARILEQASSEDAPHATLPPPNEGLSLAQISEIAAEVGIDRARVERAARDLERGGRSPVERRTLLGLPIGVSRTVELGRIVSDAEWDHLVVLLRETFDARGRLQAQGAFRQWTNGNLQVLLEPTTAGHRLRLSTRKGDATVRLAVGMGGFAIGAAMLLGALSSGGGDLGALVASAVLTTAGAVTLASTWFVLPSWARKRAAQMEDIASRVTLAPESGSPRLP